MTETEALMARIDGLEIRIAHQDRTIEDLNSTVTGHWKKIEELTGRLARLTEQLREVESSAGAADRLEPPPPHY